MTDTWSLSEALRRAWAAFERNPTEKNELALLRLRTRYLEWRCSQLGQMIFRRSSPMCRKETRQ